MPNRTMVSSKEIVPIESPIFVHEGIKYNPIKREVSFSEEAKIALQKLVHEIQSNFPNHIEQITEEVANGVIDAMVVGWEWQKATKKFLKRIAVLLKKKKNEEVKVDKEVSKKIRKFGSNQFSYITIEYQEGDKKIILKDTPIIVRPWENVDTMLKSLKIRLRFPRNTK